MTHKPRAKSLAIVSLRCTLSTLVMLTGCRSSRPAPTQNQTPNPSSPVATQQPTTPPTAPSTNHTVTPSGPSSLSEQTAAAESLTHLGIDLYTRLRNQPGNLALSPASIGIAFGMTEPGARGETLAQMRTTLHSSLDATRQAMALGALSSRWNGGLGSQITARVANRLFGHTTYTFEPSFVSLTADTFHAPLERVDFTQVDPTRAHINGWVAEQTLNKIRDLIPPAGTDATTRLVLVNAMYLNAPWAEPFEPRQTRPGPFYANGTTRASVPMMRQVFGVQATTRTLYTLVAVPYAGRSLSMLLFLPPSRDGLAQLEQSLSMGEINQAVASLSSKRVDLSLPRFRVTTDSMRLAEHLDTLGMHLPFQRNVADFTGIANPPDPRERLFISEAFHKVFVEVTEAGTEAAAATAITMMLGGGMPQPPELTLNFDHPFLFAIRDDQNGALLFLGRVVDPR